MKEFDLKPIGYVESCYPDKFGTPRQSGLVPAARGLIRLNSNLQPEYALEGLQDFSHLWVMFVFHQLKPYQFRPKVHPPRLGGKSVGVFATRSPHRPNPLGLSLVEIVKVEEFGIEVRGIDLVEGTPVLDIKPYLPEVEAPSPAKGGWAEELPPTENPKVLWSPRAEADLLRWTSSFREAFPGELRQLVEQTLRLDPRPVVYRGYEGSNEAPYRSLHAVRLYDGDVKFQFTDPKTIEILEIARNLC